MTTANITWSDGYKIGDADIDRQHRELFELADQVIRVTDHEALVGLMMSLYQHLRQHFGHEEDLMRRLAYPAYQQHKALHDLMITQLNTMAAEVAAGRWSRESLSLFMNGWVVGHVREHDSRLATYVRLKQAA